MRDGVDCIAAVTDRHAESVLIKGLRLQRQRAQGPALPPPNYKTSKGGKKRLHCLLWCLQETEHQSEREREEKGFEEREKGEGAKERG